MGRNWPRTLAVSGAVLVAGAVAALSLNGLGGDGGHGDGGDGGESAGKRPTAGDDRAPGASRTPGPKPPTGPARLGPAPASIPSVRDWRPVRGPGWKPTRDTRVVAAPDGPLADEARLLAGELKVPTSRGPARTADIELKTSAKVRAASPGGPEAYVLTSRAGRITITGGSEAGAFYGTRTLLQTYRAQGRFADGTVRDAPDRPQRGFSLDIARKHFSAAWIERRIREMGDLKLNQLQLHLSDDQAFRIESETHPEVVSTPHLSKAEVRRIVRLAASRHITVIPEFDSPGHLGAVLRAHPQLQLRSATGRVARGALDISRPAAAKLVDELLGEYTDLFPGRYWHLGGDEYPALLTSDPAATYPGLAAAARARHGSAAGIQDLATAWLNDRAATVRKHGKIPQVWNDGMHSGGVVRPSRGREVAYWTGKEYGARKPEEYLREGWKVLNLNDEYLYYVLGQPNDFTYPTGRRIYEQWTPAVLRGTSPVPAKWAGPDRIPGARFAVWGDLAGAQTTEQVARGIRMPLRAMAQKVWDPERPKRSWGDFTKLAGEVS
ncbi:beta-N-acetylhexosaminidase [Streptomyces boncukensis]|uniref:Family 20 glycosylhydrolase n=1 Tax=Streptomyces boncukensis TaxID=2711219 RepID=A0A6G4WX94_9ACTN|nr:glycoside hydrolase family 20 protein [Streptomyces boncukensis]NGO69906.1 family 20 glycosylhydrolase [Streptomyces boncukensis]